MIKYTPVFMNSPEIPKSIATEPIPLGTEVIEPESKDVEPTLTTQPDITSDLSYARKTLSKEESAGKTYSDKKTFKRELKEAYEKALKERGLSTDYADYIVAQDAHESNWGKSSLSKYYNFGGIKETRKEMGVQKDTTESFDGKTLTPTSGNFRTFKDLNEYVNYKLDLLGNSNYNIFAYSPNQLYNRLVTAPMKYATDPEYVNKLNRMYRDYLSV